MIINAVGRIYVCARIGRNERIHDHRLHAMDCVVGSDAMNTLEPLMCFVVGAYANAPLRDGFAVITLRLMCCVVDEHQVRPYAMESLYYHYHDASGVIVAVSGNAARFSSRSLRCSSK